MTLHLVKLAVGAESIQDLAAWQADLIRNGRNGQQPGELFHITRQTPRRPGCGDGSSLYWVIKGFIRARQQILELRAVKGPDGIDRCAIILHPKLFLTEAHPRKAFQGWRYLAAEDAPQDMECAGMGASGLMPPAMRRDLAELQLL